MALHLSVERALDQIDAQLFSADNDDEDLDVLEEYVDRWKRRIKEFREINAEEDD
jgi:hypothetical protein